MKTKILLVGDSLTEGFKVKEYLPEYAIINRGIYGDNTVGVLERLQKDISDAKPDAIFFLIGTNDLALERTIDEIAQNIELMINQSLSFPFVKNIFITSLLPTRNIENRPNSTINELNNLLLKLTSEYSLKYFNLNLSFIDEDGMLKSDFTNDGLHLTHLAYIEWANLLKIEIDSLNE